MSKFSNIYDIDGELIRRADEGKFTLEETEELVDKLTKKVQENPDNEVYKVYLNNAQKWLFKLYNEMDRDELIKRMSVLQDSVQNAKDEATEAEKEQLEEIGKAMEELKKEYESEEGTGEGAGVDKEVEQPVEEPTPLTQEDMLVEREGETIMEEVIDA